MPDQINRIVYVNPEGQLITISPDGSDSRVLTQPNRFFQFPAWSRNGAYLAAIGGDRLGVGVFLTTDQARPKEPELLYYSATYLPFYLYSSPDSRHVSFLTSQPEGGIGLHLAAIADKRHHLLTTGQPIFWAWNPESDRILVHSGGNGPEARLAFIDPEQDSIGQNMTQPGLFQAPGIAPSGRYWAFAEVDAYDNGQLVVEDSLKHEQITLPHEGAIALSWNPTWDQLAYISPTQSVQRFYGPLQVFDTVRKSVHTLIENTVLAFFWSPNGQSLAYLTMVDGPADDNSTAETGGSHNGVYRNSSTPAQHEQPPTEAKLYLELWVVEVETGQQRRLLTFEPAAIFINQFLPFFDQYALSHHLWSPAGNALVLPVTDGEVERIAIIATDGRPVQYITEGTMPAWSWQ